MMTKKLTLGLGLVAIALASISATTDAAERDVRTTIDVKGMTCQGCANKLVKQLNQIPGVATAQADAKKGVALAVPQQGAKLPSPRAQWEAVEKVGFKPVRLAGPYGVFTSKPKF
jgi:copper chaperone CopZ